MTFARTNEPEAAWRCWADSRDPEAGNDLIAYYYPLVAYHVQRIASGLPKNIQRDELSSYGLLGLYDALEKFDIDRDLKFDTYASFRIRGAIMDGLRKEDWMPRSLREKCKKIDAAVDVLEQRLMRRPTAEEIAEHTGYQAADVYEALSEGFFANILSMDEGYSDRGEKEDKATVNIKDERARTPEEQMEHEETLNEMTTLLHELNEKEQLVISLFYKEELTLTEIGRMLSLSTSRVSQIHSKALFKMKHLIQGEEIAKRSTNSR
ncbi:FliA/WhiG family RNA polymerase sigma factor [Aureibacillus halotolerans]|uniref:RNA polymerase sigma-28 (SigD/FliA/WhiG) subunit n=1 Tax=Aureibacillus halotolerans TaxID=1508390 RepID=A0A4R6U2T1_9BACI|nr:FliA/WhiG family RNA polymerase sigma factor [Aureibacillus halotolerans]TDQ39672.1 RNA polymerase sigma-28 (SigD/FliA/WhiG) subunit [Aureibacillus halotolerans]